MVDTKTYLCRLFIGVLRVGINTFWNFCSHAFVSARLEELNGRIVLLEVLVSFSNPQETSILFAADMSSHLYLLSVLGMHGEKLPCFWQLVQKEIVLHCPHLQLWLSRSFGGLLFFCLPFSLFTSISCLYHLKYSL